MTKHKKSNFRKKLFSLAGIGLISVLFCSFFSQFNNLVLANYEIKESEKQIKQLLMTNELLEMNFVEANRITQIKNTAENLNFEKAEKVHYIKVISGVVATK